VREPYYVPETMGIDTLLQTLKRQRVHLAIVLDEYGGVAGLVSLEDILEEIVGEIADEYDLAVAEQIDMISPGVMELDARVHVDDLNERFEYGLPEDGDFETIGGFVFSILGRIPVSGEDFTWQNLRFTVLDADKRKINRLRIEVDYSLTSAASGEA
jgi:CBS domain containing-hemolysin-like protein